MESFASTYPYTAGHFEINRSALNRRGVKSPARWLLSVLLLLANTAWPLYAGETADPGVSTPLASRLLLLDVAVTGPRIVAVGERGYILFSEDGGASWHRAEAPTGATLTGITFFGEDLGWAVGHDATILRSTDGGRRWRRVHAEREGERALFDVWFANERHGLAVGAYGLLLESTDGGEHWMRRTLDVYQAGADGEANGRGVAAGRGGDPSAFDLPATDLHLNHIAATDSGRLYLAAERGTIFRSDDRGRSWRALPSPYAGSFSGVLPLDDNAALVFGLRGHLYHWDPAGWTAIPAGTDETLTAGVRLSDGTLVLVGLGGVVLLSRDGGRSFTPQLEPDRAGFAAIAGSGPRALFLVGERGIRRLVPILTAAEAARE